MLRGLKTHIAERCRWCDGETAERNSDVSAETLVNHTRDEHTSSVYGRLFSTAGGSTGKTSCLLLLERISVHIYWC